MSSRWRRAICADESRGAADGDCGYIGTIEGGAAIRGFGRGRDLSGGDLAGDSCAERACVPVRAELLGVCARCDRGAWDHSRRGHGDLASCAVQSFGWAWVRSGAGEAMRDLIECETPPGFHASLGR